MFGRRTYAGEDLGDWRATSVEGGQCRVRVMDRLPHPADRIDETLIRVEWPDPTGKCRTVAHPDKLTTYTIVAVHASWEREDSSTWMFQD